MIIYAISDLHLSHADPKPMDVFGKGWKDHPEKIARNWDSMVTEDDIVLVAGDISWAMRLPGAVPDLDYIRDRPGRKFLIRGNHDYWWGRQSTNKIQRMLDPSITLLQGASAVIGGVGITGTRGWRMEDYNLEGPVQGDIKIYQRELTYLRQALESLPSDVTTKIVMLHYPPFDLNLRPNDFRTVLEEFQVDILVYGHIHSTTGSYLEGDVDGIAYHLVSVDHTDFSPIPVLELDRAGRS
jgi:predicted phosphohydrolase